jgi:hypothetical protein
VITDEPGVTAEHMFEPYAPRSRKIRCTLCGAVGTRSGPFRDRHLAGHPYACATCARVFTSTEGRASHARQAHDERVTVAASRARAGTPDSGEGAPFESGAGVSSTGLVRLSGLTYRQVDYWARVGVLLPDGEPTPGSGVQRVYTAAGVARARALGRLVGLGMPVGLAAHLVDHRTDDADGGWVARLGDGLLVVSEVGP